MASVSSLTCLSPGQSSECFAVTQPALRSIPRNKQAGAKVLRFREGGVRYRKNFVLCVVCLMRFFQSSGQVSSVTPRRESTRQIDQTGQKAPCTARSASALRRPRPVPARDTTVAPDAWVSRWMASQSLRSTLRARACPFSSCSSDLKAPSVPPRAIAVALFPSTVRTWIIQRWRPPVSTQRRPCGLCVRCVVCDAWCAVLGCVVCCVC